MCIPGARSQLPSVPSVVAPGTRLNRASNSSSADHGRGFEVDVRCHEPFTPHEKGKNGIT
jgi:hypothetical protein